MRLSLHLQNPARCRQAPTRQQFHQWVSIALQHYLQADSSLSNHRELPEKPELTVRLVDADESASLNATYRQKTGPTNVLSFPFVHPEQPLDAYLGDLAICAELVTQEAQQQNKTAQAHWAHLTVHGILHLLGYDHEQEQEAEVMEHLEIQILADIGFVNPYLKTV